MLPQRQRPNRPQSFRRIVASDEPPKPGLVELEHVGEVTEALHGTAHASSVPEECTRARPSAALVAAPASHRGPADVNPRATGLTTYPHVSVVCGNPEADPQDPHAIVNPTPVVA